MTYFQISDLLDSIICLSDDCPDDLLHAHLKTSILEMIDHAAMRNVCNRLCRDYGDAVYFDGGILVGQGYCNRDDADMLRDEWQSLWDSLPENAKKIAA